MIADDPPGQTAAAVAGLQLEQETFPDVAGAHAGRIERLDHVQCRLEVREAVLSRAVEFIQPHGQITVFVQVADDPLGGVAERFR